MHAHALPGQFLHQVLGLGPGQGQNRVHRGHVLEADTVVLGKMILHPLQYPGLLLGGAHHEEGVLISSDEQTIILISSSSILHPSWNDAIDRDVDIIGAKLLEIADNSFLLTLDDKLGKTGHINQTNAFSTNMIFVLDMIKELWLRE